MATITSRIGSFDENAHIEIDWNDLTGAILVLRCVNNSNKVLKARVKHLIALIDQELTASSGETTTLTLPTGLLVDSTGAFDKDIEFLASCQ